MNLSLLQLLLLPVEICRESWPFANRVDKDSRLAVDFGLGRTAYTTFLAWFPSKALIRSLPVESPFALARAPSCLCCLDSPVLRWGFRSLRKRLLMESRYKRLDARTALHRTGMLLMVILSFFGSDSMVGRLIKLCLTVTRDLSTQAYCLQILKKLTQHDYDGLLHLETASLYPAPIFRRLSGHLLLVATNLHVFLCCAHDCHFFFPNFQPSVFMV